MKIFDASACEYINIGYAVLQDCKNLVEVKLPKKVKFSSSWAFSGCQSLIQINLPKDLEFTEDVFATFRGCKSLKSVSGFDNITSLPSQLFVGCTMLEKVEGLDNVTSIGDEVFNGCTNLTLTGLNGMKWEDLLKIGSKSFNNCSALRGSVKMNPACNIAADAFSGCTLFSYDRY